MTDEDGLRWVETFEEFEAADGIAGVRWDGVCALCGRDPARGFASIGDRRYCHGGEPGPWFTRGEDGVERSAGTCYELAGRQGPRSEGVEIDVLIRLIGEVP